MATSASMVKSGERGRVDDDDRHGTVGDVDPKTDP